ncbi:MAG TPA: membrane dipeptidase, partial [Firmicutes bacterium]|nr:membrane dipeptidase [Bacillota bacterium]
NLRDIQLKCLRDKGGVIGLTFYPPFIKEKGATLDALVDHAVYIAGLIGVEHLGIGSDFDGMDMFLPELKDVTALPLLAERLFKCGFHDAEIKKILGENILRVIKDTIA